MFQNDSDIPTTPPIDNSGDAPDAGGQLPHNPEAEDAPLKVRTGANPANLGDEVPEAGDVVFPVPEPQPAEI
jgi:hypothetical protein